MWGKLFYLKICIFTVQPVNFYMTSLCSSLSFIDFYVRDNLILGNNIARCCPQTVVPEPNAIGLETHMKQSNLQSFQLQA